MNTRAATIIATQIDTIWVMNWVPTWNTSAGKPKIVLVDIKLATSDSVTGNTPNCLFPVKNSALELLFLDFHQKNIPMNEEESNRNTKTR